MLFTAVYLALWSSLAAPAGDPLGFHLDSVAMPMRDAPVEMHYSASCSPAAGGYYALRVTLAQRTGRTVATGSAEAREACTGRQQSLVLRVVPDSAGMTFRPGRISVTACLQVRHVVPHRSGGLASAWVTGDPRCTSEPHTAIVSVPEPAELGRRMTWV